MRVEHKTSFLDDDFTACGIPVISVTYSNDGDDRLFTDNPAHEPVYINITDNEDEIHVDCPDCLNS